MEKSGRLSPYQSLRYAHVIGNMIIDLQEFMREHKLVPEQLTGAHFGTLESHLRVLETEVLRRGLEQAVLPHDPSCREPCREDWPLALSEPELVEAASVVDGRLAELRRKP